MIVTAELSGRNLAIRIAGIDEPFIIEPLSGRRGQELTNTFINITAGVSAGAGMEGLLAEAVGADVYERVQTELSLSEAEGVLLPAFYWQTVLGVDGVNAFISGGEGMAGAKKALQLLVLTLGISPTTTAPSTALATLIQSPGLTPPTGVSTTTLAKLPAAKRSRDQGPKKSKRTASPQ